MRKFLRQMISDENGQISSKRIAGLLSILSLNVCLLVNTFYETEAPRESLIEAIALFAFGSFGLTSLDKFIQYKKKTKEDVNNTASN